VPVENPRPQTKTPSVAPVETGNQHNRPFRTTSHVTISLIFRRLGFSSVLQFVISFSSFRRPIFQKFEISRAIFSASCVLTSPVESKPNSRITKRKTISVMVMASSIIDKRSLRLANFSHRMNGFVATIICSLGESCAAVFAICWAIFAELCLLRE
jgi:hypothetical protein